MQFAPLAPLYKNGDAFTLTGGSIVNGATATSTYLGNGVQYNNALQQYQLLPGTLPTATTTLVQYKAITINGCADSILQSVLIMAPPVVDAGPDKTVAEGATALMVATAFGNNLLYQWQPVTNFNNLTILQPVATAIANVKYYLTATSGAGCTTRDSMTLSVLKNLLVPNAFSPNGDGVNDTWVIPYLNSYEGASVEVYNRYGNRVYSSKGYTIPWDGIVTGKPAPIGTYYYLISLGSGKKTN